ncbi:MAG: ribosomal RNA small subunit methyltransferase A [Myxococcales bacterium]|nr:ribosomal RNA small subunit methyltransferase A [Myxococcales bacterium]
MTSAFLDARAQLRRAGLRPKRSFGQNFLVAPHVLDKIARACVPDAETARAHVIELGAGLGALTRALVDRAAHVTAIERDRDLVPPLREDLAAFIDDGRLEVIEGDAQTAAFDALFAGAPAGAPRVVCGNLPYQITGKLIESAVQQSAFVDRAVFMVQLEVAERLVAAPGSKTFGALTVFTSAAFDVRRLLEVSRGNFHPPPDVTSAVVVLDARRPPRALETPTFRACVRAAFGQRRKTLRNAWSQLAPVDALEAAAAHAGVSLAARGETLDVEDFARMAEALEVTDRSSRPAP